MTAYLVVSAALLGLIFGSFASVAAYRIPRRESFVRGRSRCPECGTTITARENIPILSYFLQRGRCRHCGARISARYPFIEITTGALFALAFAKFGLSLEAALYAAFFWVLVVLTVIDLEHRLLPNRIVYPSFIVGVAGLAVAALVDDAPERLTDLAWGALIFGGFFFIIGFIYPAGMGGGDIKLAFVLGLFLGYLGGPGIVLVGMFLSFLLGGGWGIVTLLRGGTRKQQLPFGPFLVAGTVVAVALGQPILNWYLPG